MVTKDVIKVTAGSILKVLSDNYKFMPLDEDDGIGMYKATVKVSIDTDELDKKLNDFLQKESEEQSSLAKQYEDLQKLNDANTKKILELEKQLSEKNSSQNKQQILNEVAEIDKNSLYAQKIDEGRRAGETKNYEQALEFFNEAISLNPNISDGYRGRGFVYYYLKNYSQAISDCNKSIELNPTDEFSYNNRGIIHLAIKNYLQASNDFTQAINLNQNFAWAYNDRGLAYYNLKNYSQAIFDYTQAINLNPKCAIAYYNRGLLYEDLQNYTKAEEDFVKARKLGFDG